eukprot:TRINITY_DN1783_c0_g1_i1.p1 TRINITY_DN1783_c0_g1~~TRINITY_DN1783_c0_g1_i1.p1  ORF type:complete len:252 (-),score=89.83 TRINITY_DN1783_c0_g1_i1:87-842(-)
MRRFSRLGFLVLALLCLFLFVHRVSAASVDIDEDVAVDELEQVATEEEIEQLYADVEDEDLDAAGGGVPLSGRGAPANPKETGYLILHKKIDTTGFAIGNDVTIQIKIFNVGGGPAYETYVKDGWPLEHFKIVEGELSAQFDIIDAGEHAEFNFTIQPLTVGGMKGFPAVAFYKPTENGEPMTVTSNFYGDQIPILTAARFKKLSKKHELENALYWIGFVTVLFGPLASLYYYSSSFIYGVPAALVKAKAS